MLFEGRCCTCKENNSTPRLSWKKGVIEKLIIGMAKTSEVHQFEQNTGNRQKQ